MTGIPIEIHAKKHTNRRPVFRRKHFSISSPAFLDLRNIVISLNLYYGYYTIYFSIILLLFQLAKSYFDIEAYQTPVFITDKFDT